MRPVLACCLALGLGAPALAADPRGAIRDCHLTAAAPLPRQADDLLSAGTPPATGPILHCAGERVGVRLTLAAAGIAPGARYRLLGAGPEPGLCFCLEGTMPAAAECTLTATADAALGRPFRKIEARLRWTLAVAAQDPIALGATGPHVIYVTAGAPRHTERPESAVTVPRLELAVARLAAAQQEAGGECSGPRLVHALMKQNGAHYLPARHQRGAAAWQVPASRLLAPPGASCISIVDFVRLLCDLGGIEGEVQTTAFCARAAAPARARRGGLGDPPEFKRGPAGQTWQLFLVDHTNSNHGQVGGVGGMNYYEAALQYTWQGRRYYYPGGTDRVYDAPDDVLRIFRTLAWAEYDPHRRDWVVREVVHDYLRPGDRLPPSVSLEVHSGGAPAVVFP